jgi:hypothetical protein
VAKSKARKKRTLVGRFLRLFVRLAKAVVLALVLAAVWSAGFIAMKCYSGSPSQAAAPLERDNTLPEGYRREEASTYLTLPEWYIVYNTDEYARALNTRPPSAFPYVGSITQYWRYYGAACAATKGAYPFSRGNHLMLAVIGTSFSIEYAIKGLYENTVGRLSEWVSGTDTPEDAFARATAAEYGTFMHTVPWYDFPFAQKLKALWTTTPATGPGMFRKWERRAALSLDYAVKAVYGRLIGGGSHATYGQEALTIHARVQNAAPDVFADGAVKKIKDAGRDAIVAIPRYEAFTGHALRMIGRGVRFVDIAGNDEILVTVLVPAGWNPPESSSVVLDERVLTDVTTRRVGLRVPVSGLHTVVKAVLVSGGRVEHLYDY